MDPKTQKIIIIVPNYLAPIASISTQITSTALVGWTCFGLVTIGFTTLGALYLFQLAERKRWQNHEVIIDVTVSLSD